VATTKQVRAAKRNIQKAQRAAKSKRTIAHLPEATRRDLGKQAAKARQRGGHPGHALEDRTRGQLSRAREAAEHPWPLEDGQVGSDPRASLLAPIGTMR
jgi:hypothetical protein